MSLKTTMKRALHSSGIASTLARRDGASFILAAHIVQKEEAGPLADVIRLLRRSFSLVSLDEMLDALRAGRCRNLVALTFDDGLRNQVTVAYDVLSSLRAPATFYVCPAPVGTHPTRRGRGSSSLDCPACRRTSSGRSTPADPRTPSSLS